MATRREREPKPERTRRPPGTTPEARENQLVALAVDRAEQQLRDGTASAQVITHYLKLGSTRERLEQMRMEREVKLLDARVEEMKSSARMEELYSKALDAMKGYKGLDSGEIDE